MIAHGSTGRALTNETPLDRNPVERSSNHRKNQSHSMAPCRPARHAQRQWPPGAKVLPRLRQRIRWDGVSLRRVETRADAARERLRHGGWSVVHPDRLHFGSVGPGRSVPRDGCATAHRGDARRVLQRDVPQRRHPGVACDERDRRASSRRGASRLVSIGDDPLQRIEIVASFSSDSFEVFRDGDESATRGPRSVSRSGQPRARGPCAPLPRGSWAARWSRACRRARA